MVVGLCLGFDKVSGKDEWNGAAVVTDCQRHQHLEQVSW